MAKGYPMCGGAAYNILDLPAPPRDLVVTTAPATIKVQFSASGLEAWTVYKIGGKPRHPYDGWRNIQKMDGGGATLCTATLTEHVENDVEYGVRIFIRGQYGFQTSEEGATALVTPRAEIPLKDMPIGAEITINLNGTPWVWFIIQQGKPSDKYDISFESSTTLLLKEIYENRIFDSVKNFQYPSCPLYRYLNNDFMNLFDEGIREKIKQVNIYSRYNTNLPAKAYLLSCAELGWSSDDLYRYDVSYVAEGSRMTFFDAGTSGAANQKRVGCLNGVASGWWTRSSFDYVPGTNKMDVRYVNSTGEDASGDCTGQRGVRPAITLPDNLMVRPVNGNYILL